MSTPSRRTVLTAGASAFGVAFAGCLTGGADGADGTDGTDGADGVDGNEDWDVSEPIPATAATMYKGPTCDCCDSYAEYLDASLEADLETVVTDDLRAVKDDYGIDADLRSCHTVELDDYLVEGHVPAEPVSALFDDELEIAGIALPGMPPGSPGMGGEKDETWTVYEIRPGTDPAVYTTL